ncbi:hypothetical protein [Nocardia sp.]|uniref:hypothetical protein n=1 Tax=Nocardia sp. TaxID=1821 RepID=UPI0026364B12|nr:hypothetical protein [Nocardia sp.]
MVLISASLLILALAVAALVDLLMNTPLPVWISCPNCDGRGVMDRDISDPHTCSACQGWGRVQDVDTAHDLAEEPAQLFPSRLRRQVCRACSALRTLTRGNQ